MGLMEHDGDMWDTVWDLVAEATVWRVIPTNGSRNKAGQAVMGRGLAKQCQERYPEFRTLLGLHLKAHGNRVSYSSQHGVITFPVKHVWDQRAVLDLIRDSCDDLVETAQEPEFSDAVFLVPRVGCGNGGRDWETEVKPILEEKLAPVADRVIIVYSREFEGQ